MNHNTKNQMKLTTKDKLTVIIVGLIGAIIIMGGFIIELIGRGLITL